MTDEQLGFSRPHQPSLVQAQMIVTTEQLDRAILLRKCILPGVTHRAKQFAHSATRH